jgi:uncharacterized protein YwgA
MNNEDWNRVATITALAMRMKDRGNLGRTALMKFMYFLQAIKGLQLGYRFSLYSYGPFDSVVLDDLSTAISLGAVHQSIVRYPSSTTGYNIQPADRASDVKSRAKAFLDLHSSDLDWVVDSFGACNAGEMELLSTILFVQSEPGMVQDDSTHEQTITTVQRIKPHFTKEQIKEGVTKMLVIKSTVK